MWVTTAVMIPSPVAVVMVSRLSDTADAADHDAADHDAASDASSSSSAADDLTCADRLVLALMSTCFSVVPVLLSVALMVASQALSWTLLLRTWPAVCRFGARPLE